MNRHTLQQHTLSPHSSPAPGSLTMELHPVVPHVGLEQCQQLHRHISTAQGWDRGKRSWAPSEHITGVH